MKVNCMRSWLLANLFGICLILMAQVVSAEDAIHLYLDADQTGARASGLSIEQGIRTALHEVNYTLAGKPVKLIVKDHHGSSVRSKRHLASILKDHQALAVFSGLHSPPLLDNLAFINDNKILMLDPWAAAGPITRYKKGKNWVFRLSIDDSKAGEVIVKNALNEGFKKPYLLLEETGWGKSNFKTMSKALKNLGLNAVGTQWFNWNLGETGAKIILREIQASGADCILLVANAHEGKTFAKALLALNADKRLPIRSHWGITGGDFPEVINANLRQGMDLKFLQTRFSFISSKQTPFSKQVFRNASDLFPEMIQRKKDIQAPTGFIHAYDLTRLMIAAINNSQFGDDMAKNRATLRDALEQIKNPVVGLIKTYQQPFKPYTPKEPDAHEALTIHDLVMAYYGKQNQIFLDN